MREKAGKCEYSKKTIVNDETKNPNLFTNIILDDLLSNSNLPLRGDSAHYRCRERFETVPYISQPPTVLSLPVMKFHTKFHDDSSIAIACKKKNILQIGTIKYFRKMKHLIVICLISVLFGNCSSTSEKKPTNSYLVQNSSPNNWSDYQGYMNWEDARKKCSDIEMKLPTREELELAYNTGITQAWGSVSFFHGKNGYWTSDESSENFAYRFNLINGSTPIDLKYFKAHVRCIL